MHGNVCLPVLPSGNGLEVGIPGLGVGSKQRQLRKCLCRCELNATTITYKHICNGCTCTWTQNSEWLSLHVQWQYQLITYAYILNWPLAGACWAEWSAALTGGGREEKSVYACVCVCVGQRTWRLLLDMIYASCCAKIIGRAPRGCSSSLTCSTKWIYIYIYITSTKVWW